MDVRVDHKESWVPKNRSFELCCLKLLRFPGTARRPNQSILKEISPEYSVEGLMLKLKLQYFGHLMWRTNSLEKTLMLGKIEGDDRGWDGWMASPTQWTWVWAIPGDSEGQGRLVFCRSWGHKESDTTEWLNWTELIHSSIFAWRIPQAPEEPGELLFMRLQRAGHDSATNTFTFHKIRW